MNEGIISNKEYGVYESEALGFKINSLLVAR